MSESVHASSVDHDAEKCRIYYADKRILWRNVISLMICNGSWAFVGTIIGPLMIMHMNDCGVTIGTIGLINAINLWAVSVLVMYFSWKSDHTVSRFGRRMPYFFISAFFIIIAQVLFPWFHHPITIITLFAVLILFNDLKASTYVLLPIDCFPRERLAQFNSIFGIVGGLVGFIALQWGFGFPEDMNWVPYVGGAAIMTTTSFVALAIKEPPITNSTKDTWNITTTLAIGWKKRSNILLMLGVGLIHSFSTMYYTWIWLFAKNDLNLDKSIIGPALSWSPLIMVALAWPTGWIIDRFGGLKVVVVYFSLQLATFFVSLNITDASSLMLAAVMMTITAPLYVGADMMVFKSAPGSDVGSITATNSFTRNLMQGCISFGSGYLIQFTNMNYHTAFYLGMVMSSIGFMFFFIHRSVIGSQRETSS